MNADRLDYYVNRFRGIELKRDTIKEILYELVLEAQSPQENVAITDNSAVIAKLQSDKARLSEALSASNKELHNWDDSLRISAELLGDSKPTRLPIQKLINENKALLAEMKGL